MESTDVLSGYSQVLLSDNLCLDVKFEPSLK
jgi:hypothetical protein